MTIIHTVSPRTGDARRPISPLAPEPRYYRERVVRSRRPGPARPADLRTRYHGTGVAMSTAPHRRRAGLGGDDAGTGPARRCHHPVAGPGGEPGADGQRRLLSTSASAAVPDKLAVVRVEAGESLQDVAHRVAPDAPARQVADRIRELNDLKSPAVAAGQTLIAPIG